MSPVEHPAPLMRLGMNPVSLDMPTISSPTACCGHAGWYTEQQDARMPVTWHTQAHIGQGV